MLRAIVALMIAVLLPSAAQAEKRIALLIGNQGYTRSSSGWWCAHAPNVRRIGWFP
jgi:hypothetical protein